jgi:hypothetical protein
MVGLGILTAIGLQYRRRRMFAAPFATIWAKFWMLEAAKAMGVSDHVQLLSIAIITAAGATVVTMTIPYTIEDRRKKNSLP